VVAAIRRFTDSDLDVVVAFSVAAWEAVYASFERVMGPDVFPLVYPDWRATQADDVRAACQDPKNDVWVAVVDRRPVGFVVTQTEREGTVNGGQVYMIAVDPAHQRRGVADMLLSHAVAELRAGGVDVVSIGTGGDAGHAPARALYRKHGFRGLPLAVYYLPLGASATPGDGAVGWSKSRWVADERHDDRDADP
jgi:ribosomal protein S18 acetylase RimI-like enzyme